jgi:hypothetical protein
MYVIYSYHLFKDLMRDTSALDEGAPAVINFFGGIVC